jgi:hypothetical protein
VGFEFLLYDVTSTFFEGQAEANEKAARGYGGMFSDEIKPDQSGLKVALGPELFVHGKVIHMTPKTIKERNVGLHYEGTIYLFYNQFFQMENDEGGTQQDVVLKPSNGEADFVAGPLFRWPVQFDLGDIRIQVEANNLPKSGLIIDLAQAPSKVKAR